MANDGTRGFGWWPDVPDHRDYTPSHPAMRRVLRRLEPMDPSRMAGRVDWREYFGPVDDQCELATSSVHACIGMVHYFERRATGRLLRPSRLFVYHAARRLNMTYGDSGTSLRATIKAIKRFGMPPERHWPYRGENVDAEPPAFTYRFRERIRDLRYLRLDERGISGGEVLARLRSFLAAGFVCALGVPVCSAISDDAELAFPTSNDCVDAGLAVLAVGCDDSVRVRTHKGALLIRNSWGANWGERGYGWLPYAFIEERLAQDVWTLVKKSWLKSGEFEAPR